MVAGTAAVLALVLTSFMTASSDDPAKPDLSVLAPEGYPEEWRTSWDDARATVPFHLIQPAIPEANEGNLEAVYVWPGGSAVAVHFPPPGPTSPPIRQEYLAVYLATWGHGDPLADYEEDIERDPQPGKAIYSIDGIPALGVLPRSPADVEHANPAFLRLEIDGLEVEISGGDDLELLMDMARSMIARSRG